MQANHQRAMTTTTARRCRLLAAVALGMAAGQPLALSAQVGKPVPPQSERIALRGTSPATDGHARALQ